MRKVELPTLIFAAGLLVWIVNAAIVWLGASPLGHDEAQYALAARDLLAGDEPRWFYVSSGMSVLAAIGATLGDGEVALRTPTFLLGVGFVLAAGELARRLYGFATAAWVVAALAGMRSLMLQSTDLLTDVPATAFLLAGTALIVGETVGERSAEAGPRWRVVAAAPLLAIALYLRYASCVPIAILGAATLVIGWPAIARRPLPIVATALLFLALLVPHAMTAIDATGSPLGILLASKGVPGQTWIAEGLATYVTSNPFRYYGLLAPPILLAGLAALAVTRDRKTVLLWIVAVADIVALGLLSHAQVRYIFFGTTLLVILGVEVIRRWTETQRPAARRAIVAVAMAAILVAWVFVAIGQVRRGPRRFASTGPARAAAAAMRADAGGARCEFVGDEFPTLEHYSGCRGSMWPWDAIATTRIYVVHTPATAPVTTLGTPRVILDRPDVTVTRYDR